MAKNSFVAEVTFKFWTLATCSSSAMNIIGVAMFWFVTCLDLFDFMDCRLKQILVVISCIAVSVIDTLKSGQIFYNFW